MARGILVTHRDGSTSYVTKENLNMPKWNFRRLYYKRMLGKGPVKHRQGDRSLGTFTCWIHGLDEGQEHFSAQWDWPVLWSLTKTLSFKPTNPHFIVQVEAEYTKRHYEKADLSNVWQTHKRATLKWYDEWQDQNLWGGVTETGQIVSNPLAFQLAQYPDLLFGLGLITLVIEAGFPLILLIPSVKARLLFPAAVTAFHIANFVLLYIGFLLPPIAFLIFFSLVPVHTVVKAQLDKFLPARSTQ